MNVERLLSVRCAGAVFVFSALGCARAPSPLAPGLHGSIGTPNRGVLTEGVELRSNVDGLAWLRSNDRHWALPRFARSIEHAAAVVAQEKPGSKLIVGDLSVRTGGGPLAPHFSHRSGVDADLLFYALSLDGAPVQSPGFVHFGADGLARDEAHARWLRFDVEREWLLIRTLLEDPEARVQWVFVSDVVQAMLLEWAVAEGDSPETVRRARSVMLQPNPGGVHDDHIHVRTACSPREMAEGCEPIGPRRPWLVYELPRTGDTDEDLALALMQPLEQAPALGGTTAASAPSNGEVTVTKAKLQP
jgi:penicillin-insensitive murein endopeptidase